MIGFDFKQIQKGFSIASEKLAEEYYSLLISNIKENKFKNKNSPSTIKRKGSDIPMIDTGELLKNIIVEKTLVKMKEGNHHGGLTYDELMSVLEYGRLDKGILPMAVWRKTKQEFEERAKLLVEETFKKLK